MKNGSRNSRRNFIRETGLAAASMLLSHPLLYAAERDEPVRRLTVLHTNDVHSRLDPFPMDGSVLAGKGGVAARSALIRQLRSENDNVLLLDSGDIFQGTPYFNIFKGEPELKAMQMMGYEATVMGNHDFDAGIDVFAEQMGRFAKFPVVMCNYDFNGTSMENRYVPYTVIRKGKLKIGITGVGIELEGLVPRELYGMTKYLDPVKEANLSAYELKKKKGCDFVICLSHLGDLYSGNKISDEILAKETEHIDLILGGHTHRFFDSPRVYMNLAGREVIVNQAGWGGVKLGRLDYEFSSGRGKKLGSTQLIPIEMKSAE